MADELPPPNDTPPPTTSSGGNGESHDPLRIEDELKESYLQYAMSVIVSRALPDVRDGLKPSQRRILLAMNDLGLGPNSSTSKCAGIVGETMKRYHPHGDGAIYPTLVRMAQEWNMHHLLIKGQGNFGSVAGLPPAAMRYTEARLSAVAAEMLEEPGARDRRFRRQLRRQVPRTARLAVQISQLARQWFGWHCRGHGHRNPTAQSPRSLRRRDSPHRRSRCVRRSTHRIGARSRLPHGRHHLRSSRHLRRLSDGPRQDHLAGAG